MPTWTWPITGPGGGGAAPRTREAAAPPTRMGATTSRNVPDPTARRCVETSGPPEAAATDGRGALPSSPA